MTFFEARYQVERRDDGAVIKDVPFFELGVHHAVDKAGKLYPFDYNESWAQKALANFQALKDKGYLPTFFPGHKSKDNPEPPAMGFLDNIRLKGKELFADLVKIKDDTLAILNHGDYPYRSAEVSAENAFFGGLAMLGKTRPYFKQEPLLLQYAEHFGESVLLTPVYFYQSMTLPDLMKQDEQREETGDAADELCMIQQNASSVLYDLLWNSELTDADRATAILQLQTDYLALVSTCLTTLASVYTSPAPPIEGAQMMDAAQLAKFEERLEAIQSSITVANARAEKAETELTQFKDSVTTVIKTQQDESLAHKVASFTQFRDNLAAGRLITHPVSGLPLGVAAGILKEIPILELVAGSPTVKFSENGAEVEVPLAQRILSLFADMATLAAKGELLIPVGEVVPKTAGDTVIPVLYADKLMAKMQELAVADGTTYDAIKTDANKLLAIRSRAVAAVAEA